MKLTELETEIETPKGLRYLVRKGRFIPVHDRQGKLYYQYRPWLITLPRWLNWLWAWLAGR